MCETRLVRAAAGVGSGSCGRGIRVSGTYKWEFKARFRRGAFGWRSQPAILRIRQAVAEIKKVARKDRVLAAEGAVLFLERISGALEQVDSSSGAIGTAVCRAISAMAPIIGAAPADDRTRAAWLDRLFEAHAADQMPYIESLADYWGELCGSAEVASAWADHLLDITRRVLSPDQKIHDHFHGTTACLSALLRAGRYQELIDLLGPGSSWHYNSWAVRARMAMGRHDEAVEYAESSRRPWSSDAEIDGLCEEALRASGRVEEAYSRYALSAIRGGTFLATFRAVAAKYPHKAAAQILDDLVRTTPGDPGKWFAAAKDAGLYDEALALAGRSPCDPRTLTRAARDLIEDRPAFAREAGMLALDWLVQGYGYDVTGPDVWAAFDATMKAADRTGMMDQARDRIRRRLAQFPHGSVMVAGILERALDRGDPALPT